MVSEFDQLLDYVNRAIYCNFLSYLSFEPNYKSYIYNKLNDIIVEYFY